MLTTLWTGLVGALIRIITAVATKEVFEKLIIFSAEKLVKHSKTTYDDEFLEIIKDALTKK